jgi:hypothetical protein
LRQVNVTARGGRYDARMSQGTDIRAPGPPGRRAVFAAIALYLVWTLATWLLEGRIDTFGRPGAVADRLIYTGVANMLVGLVGAGLAIRVGGLGQSAFGANAPSPLWIAIGLALGLGLYFGQGAPSADPVVLLNASAQVLVVSAAEVTVCWGVAAASLRRVIGGPRWLAALVAAAVGSLLFGLYHFAHSAPFNQPGMVAFLAGVGLLTGAFHLVSRDIYATIAFHNCLGVYGVVQALSASGGIDAFRSLQPPLLITALAGIAVLAATDALIVRRSRP